MFHHSAFNEEQSHEVRVSNSSFDDKRDGSSGRLLTSQTFVRISPHIHFGDSQSEESRDQTICPPFTSKRRYQDEVQVIKMPQNTVVLRNIEAHPSTQVVPTLVIADAPVVERDLYKTEQTTPSERNPPN